MPDASCSVMWTSVCGCPTIRATTSSSREISFLFLGKWYMAASGQRVRQEAADWGWWGACCGELQQTRGAYNPSFPSRKSLLLQPLISATFYPNCFFLSDLWKIILIGICESNVGVESTQQPRFLDPQHPLMAKHGNFLFSMILASVSVKHCQASTSPDSAHSIMDH